MKNILVTGGAGFIGSSLVDKLLNDEKSVTVLDNFDTFYSKQIKMSNLKKAFQNPLFKLIEGDIRDKKVVMETLSTYKVDTVIHLAAKAGVRPSLDNPFEYYDVNITGTLNILESMRLLNIKKMIFGSSSSVYGNVQVPFSELAQVDYPISPYAASKKSGELICHVFSHIFGFDITCLRFFTVYGPRQRPDLAIHKFTKHINDRIQIPVYGDGSTARDYTYIDDIVDGVCCALNHLKGYHIYNLGESRVIYINELIKLIEEEVGKKALIDSLPLQPGDVQITYADITKAKNEIGYNPQFEIKEGIENFVKWYMQTLPVKA